MESRRRASANNIVATPHRGACSLLFDLTSDEISATGGRQRFARIPNNPLANAGGFFYGILAANGNNRDVRVCMRSLDFARDDTREAMKRRLGVLLCTYDDK